MSLGAPELYIGLTRMQNLAVDDRPVLAGISYQWGTDSFVDFEGTGTLSGQLLIRSQQDLSFLTVGQQLGLIDPATSQTLFAGRIATITARPDEQISTALRVRFTAADTSTELENAKAYDVDWPIQDSGAARRNLISDRLPGGWFIAGGPGYTDDWGATWMKFDSVPVLELLDMYCRGHIARRHNTTIYTIGAGLSRRITITPERKRDAPYPSTLPGTAGVWDTGGIKPSEATGVAVLPAAVVARNSVEWEKTPDDAITDVELASWVYPVADPENNESSSWPRPMSQFVDNSTMIAKYGVRQLKLQTDLRYLSNTYPMPAEIINQWLDADAKWRATAVEIPDSRKVDTAAFRNLISCHTRHMAVLAVKDIAGIVPTADPLIHAYVIGGAATWTGKKWTATLTLGRALD